MLVLTRKIRESIQINRHITVTVLKIRGNTVRLGIDAPRHVRVVRGELTPHEEATEWQTSPAVKDSETDGGPASEQEAELAVC